MINLMKYTYILDVDKIKKELEKLWTRYQDILNKDSSWEELNEARAILFILGHTYCEDIAVSAIERRLHLLKEKITLLEFFNLIDSNSKRLEELRKDKLFAGLEKFYRVIKEFKNKPRNKPFSGYSMDQSNQGKIQQFITQAKSQGMNRQQIKTSLLNAGWKEQDINKFL